MGIGPRLAAGVLFLFVPLHSWAHPLEEKPGCPALLVRSSETFRARSLSAREIQLRDQARAYRLPPGTRPPFPLPESLLPRGEIVSMFNGLERPDFRFLNEYSLHELWLMRDGSVRATLLGSFEPANGGVVSQPVTVNLGRVEDLNRGLPPDSLYFFNVPLEPVPGLRWNRVEKDVSLFPMHGEEAAFGSLTDLDAVGNRFRAMNTPFHWFDGNLSLSTVTLLENGTVEARFVGGFTDGINSDSSNVVTVNLGDVFLYNRRFPTHSPFAFNLLSPGAR